MIKTVDPFYKSARWQRQRQAVLRRDGYACQICRRYGRMVQAATVHHVLPRDEWPDFQWDPWNLIALCSACHDELHDRNTGALTDKGRELMDRTLRKSGKKI